MRFLISVIIFLFMFTAAQAELVTKTVEYMHGDVVLEGYLAWDDSFGANIPGVMVVHEWTGINDYTKQRVEMLAKMGYVAFAADIYGKGIRPKNTDEASKQATIYRSDRELMRARAQAGLNYLRELDLSNPTKLAAIGYCFGGGVVLELARSGAEVNGVVSFHGNLDTPNPEDAKNILGKLLVQHGAADPYVPHEQVMAFWDEMNNAGVDWYMTAYGGAVHSFTNPNSGDDPSTGAAYDAHADKRSWQEMQDFFNEIF
ncbi:MAG: prolyl oligopeptidase family serine peptidase [candidate division Zixibacteria bacterium]|nr:prolyl oligopeptidase family serine peptidase [candidate division Zixibacteria bacterium]